MSSNLQNSRLESLISLKEQKLISQKSLSDEFHEIVLKLSISNNQKRKNLVAAIAVAKQPGYFAYYEPPSEIQSLESSNVLKQLAQQISKLNREIELLNEEIRHEFESKASNMNTSTELDKISQWYEVYGRPSRPNDDRLTSFVPNNKVYGGTSHHRSFKSVSVTMKKGRLI
jgi:hypothetical protein